MAIQPTHINQIRPGFFDWSTSKVTAQIMERLIGFEPIHQRWQRCMLPLNIIAAKIDCPPGIEPETKSQGSSSLEIQSHPPLTRIGCVRATMERIIGFEPIPKGWKPPMLPLNTIPA